MAEPGAAAGDEADQPRSWGLLLWRFGKIVLVVSAVIAIGQLIGIDIVGWAEEVWERITSVDPWYIAAACAIKTGQTAFVALGLRNILRASYPDEDISYRFAFGTYTVQVAGNSVLPAKGGTILMLGVWRLSIPRSAFATLVAIVAVNSLFFSVVAGLNFLLLLLWQPEAAGEVKQESGLLDWIGENPVWAGVIAVALALLVTFLARRYWPKVKAMLHHLAKGAAILRAPWRYVYGVVVPQFVSYLFRLGFTAVLMAAFGIPVTLRSVLLLIAAGTVSGAIQFTPGGVGTKQAIDCVALEEYADCADVTAYSLSQQAISTGWNLVLGAVGLVWAFGWSDAKDLIKRRKEIIAQVKTDESSEATRRDD